MSPCTAVRRRLFDARRLALLAACSASLLLVSGCLLPRPAATLPRAGQGYVAVLSGEMPPPIDLVARHAWIVVHFPDGRQRRFEYGGGGGDEQDAFADFTGGDLMVHGVIAQTADELRAIVACLEDASVYARRKFPHYVPIPGPNSNTYIDVLLRRCAIRVELPATAIGRDYRGAVGASVTESGLGVQLETPVLGVRVGLVDGVEVHLAGLALGVHFWPPGITVPVNPGRLGFSTESHHFREHELDREAPERTAAAPRQFGLGTAWLSANAARPQEPSKMGGLEARGTVGAMGRALYGKRVGYGFGADFELGMGWPASFAYAVHLYPAGLGVMFGPTGYVGVFAGLGASGVTRLVPPALELPLEARLEFDVTRYARLGFRAQAAWNLGQPARRQSGLGHPVLDELTFGALARFGRTRQYRGGFLGSGWFVGTERRELMGSAWWGVSFGVESDVAW